MFIAKLFHIEAAKMRCSTALLFGAMRKAYYSVIIEFVLGLLLTPAEREALIEGTTMVFCAK